MVVDARIWTHSQWEGGAMALVEEERSAAVSEVVCSSFLAFQLLIVIPEIVCECFRFDNKQQCFI